ncbi:EARP and GARP complex-interacting protein 1 isoform X4 [Sagmatias obliquidens]|uniref:EARP and GARP complex-interacting protein 1 isoform X4 n=1 Tax=Sagmatias obliquidens TaxID=3371155 RepID=UPI000F4456E8|nr:EARP and GARP complex-interacting protein 1 isoform X4 [Lagenorhynchus obliquidens]
MEDDAPVIYGLEFQIHIIDFDDENNIINKNVLLHQAGEIWHISASPADKGVLATCYNKTADGKVVTCAAVWRMPAELEPGGHESPEDAASPAHALELLCHLGPAAHGSTACVAWEPAGDGKRVISLADNHILLWDLQESSSQAVLASSASLEGKGQLKFTTGRWSPHHNCTQVATANDTAVRGWDTRTMSQIYCIESAHGQLVRDLDFNPNKQYYLASCGDDCRVKFWDTRNVTEPVKTLEEHSHWVWGVRYNHSHDQLVLTGSSDSRVILSNMVSISSEPFGHLVDDDDLSEQEERCQGEDLGPRPGPAPRTASPETLGAVRETSLTVPTASPCWLRARSLPRTASLPPMRSTRTACTPWTGPQPTPGSLPP